MCAWRLPDVLKMAGHHLGMLLRGLGIDPAGRRGAGQVAVGEFVEQGAAHRARRAFLAGAVHRDEDADVGVGE